MGKNKASIEFIVIIIFLLAVLIILIGFQLKLFGSAQQETPKNICKTDVTLNAALRFKGSVLSSKLNCPTQMITIKETDESAIKAKLATAMYDCWDQFGQGKLELFSDNGLFCSVCSVINFEKKDMAIGHFTDYLMTAKAPAPNQKITYMDFLQGYETPKAKEVYEDPGIFNSKDSRLENQIDTSKTYSVMFVYGRGEKGITNLATNLKTTTPVLGAGVGGALGAGAGVAIAVFAIGSNPVGWVTGIGLGVGALTGLVWGLFVHEPPQWMALTFMQEHTAEKFNTFQCDFLPAEQSTAKS